MGIWVVADAEEPTTTCRHDCHPCLRVLSLQWRAFQADRTSLFDRIIGVIGQQIERQQEDNAFLAYWWVARWTWDKRESPLSCSE